MSLFSIDVESDAQSPAVGSMVSFGAVKISDPSVTFYGKVRPITHTWEPEALIAFRDKLGLYIKF